MARAQARRPRIALVVRSTAVAAGILAVLVLGYTAGERDVGSASRTAAYAEIADHVAEELRVFRLAAQPEVVIFDYPSYTRQARALNRVAALVEKRHLPRDRIVSQAELGSYIHAANSDFATFYYGHNYAPADLARFFAIATESSVELSAAELELRARLLNLEAIELRSGHYKAGDGASYVISIVSPRAPELAPDQGDRARAIALAHELGHAWYAVNEAYHAYARKFWYEVLTQADRAAFRRFLARRDYDVSNENLVIDEAQAYLAFTPDRQVVSDAALNLPAGRLAELRQRFRPPALPPWHREP